MSANLLSRMSIKFLFSDFHKTRMGCLTLLKFAVSCPIQIQHTLNNSPTKYQKFCHALVKDKLTSLLRKDVNSCKDL